jgi:hypothetical protein
MSAGKHDCILGSGIADDTLSLGFISDIGSVVINAIDIIQIKDRVIILQGVIDNYILTRNFCLRNLYLRVPGPSVVNYP